MWYFINLILEKLFFTALKHVNQRFYPATMHRFPFEDRNEALSDAAVHRETIRRHRVSLASSGHWLGGWMFVLQKTFTLVGDRLLDGKKIKIGRYFPFHQRTKFEGASKEQLVFYHYRCQAYIEIASSLPIVFMTDIDIIISQQDIRYNSNTVF